MTSINFKIHSIKIIGLLILVFRLSSFGQSNGSIPYKSQEVSETDGVPVLIKHLPDWENVRGRTTFARRGEDLTPALGNRPVLELIDFSGGTEAVTAPYDAGKLLIIEYSNPQSSIEADKRFTAMLGENVDGTTVYRRIGNYNAFIFDASDAGAAKALLDQVKYEKTVQWLGPNPFRVNPERVFVLQASDLFLSTVVMILIGIAISIFGGLIVGYAFFLIREQQRAGLATFSDAGGMTRLNLDGFTPEIVPKGLLKD